MKTLMCIALALATLTIQTAQAEIYKCLGSGNTPEAVYYQDEPCQKNSRAYTSLPQFTMIQSPDMTADADRKKRLTVMYLKQRIRAEERTLARMYRQIGEDLSGLSTEPGYSLQDAVQDQYEANYRNTNGLPLRKQEDSEPAYDLEGQISLIKATGDNRIEQQKYIIQRLYRQLDAAERRADS